jgi:iron-sulfur cluster repair protein YtfE (RIC family)
MDPLIDISYVHKRIYELPNMYQKIMESVNFYNVVEYVNGLNKLFKDIIAPHFDLEETQIFPPAFAKEELGLREVISQLLQEHREIVEKLARLNEASSKLELKAAGQQREKDQLTALCTEITQELTNHAQKEDTDFFPFVKNILFNFK